MLEAVVLEVGELAVVVPEVFQVFAGHQAQDKGVLLHVEDWG
jgi:hypothetical protein